jgi:hypothetical protein
MVTYMGDEFKSFILQGHIGTMVSVPFIPKGDLADESCSLFLEACNSDCITLARHPVKKRRRQKAGGSTPVITVAQKRSHIPMHYTVVINNPTGVVLCFDRWWWENDF